MNIDNNSKKHNLTLEDTQEMQQIREEAEEPIQVIPRGNLRELDVADVYKGGDDKNTIDRRKASYKADELPIQGRKTQGEYSTLKKIAILGIVFVLAFLTSIVIFGYYNDKIASNKANPSTKNEAIINNNNYSQKSKNSQASDGFENIGNSIDEAHATIHEVNQKIDKLEKASEKAVEIKNKAETVYNENKDTIDTVKYYLNVGIDSVKKVLQKEKNNEEI